LLFYRLVAKAGGYILLEIVFFTSNRTKLAHLRYIGQRYGVRVRGFKEKTYHATYSEPRIDDRNELLRLSYLSALGQWNRRNRDGQLDQSFFILEDTSVEIVALSAKRETPGVNVKFWMRGMTFRKLDGMLKRRGNDRRAIVRSDLIVHVPQALHAALGIERPYLHFRGETRGKVVEIDSTVQQDLVHPWLDDKTFNRWFVPDGFDVPLSKLSIEAADRADFRERAFSQLVAILSRFQLNRVPHESEPFQIELLEDAPTPPVFLICGPTCAGKTTVAQHWSEAYGVLHLEASDFMRKAFWERHGLHSSLNIGEFAEAALLAEPGIVAKQVVDFINQRQIQGAVITGFRAPREVEILRLGLLGRKIALIFIDAPYETRWERAVQRARTIETADGFATRNQQEQQMGIEKIAEMGDAVHIENTSTTTILFDDLDARYGEALRISGTANVQMSHGTSLERLILLTLLAEKSQKGSLTTTEIATQIRSRFGQEKHKDNVSRYFNQEYHAFYKASERTRHAIQYELSATGVSEANRLSRRQGEQLVARANPRRGSDQLELKLESRAASEHGSEKGIPSKIEKNDG
jgi:adenylate kinase family enzyme/inosine/xanthosine triphosphate pyrophosphatase family protein